MMHGTKYTRQLMNHQKLASALLADPGLLADPRLRVRIAQKRQHARGAYLSYLDVWDRLLAAGDPTEVVQHVLGGDDDHAAMMRAVSPLGVLLTDRQRHESAAGAVHAAFAA